MKFIFYVVLVPNTAGSKNKMVIGGPTDDTAGGGSQQTNRAFTKSQQKDLMTIRRHIYDRLSHLNPRKVMIDGFKYGEFEETGPFSWQIVAPIK